MRAIAIGCALQAFQQLGGINTVMYYSTTMIKMSGVKDNTQAIWLSCIPSFMNSAFALVSMVIVERLPRRRLLLSTLLGTIVGLSLLGGAYYTIGTTTAPSDPTNSTCGGSGVTNCDTCVAVDGCAFCAPTRSEMGRCFIPTAADNCTDPTYYRTDDVCYSPYSWTLIAAMVFYIAMFATGIGTLAWTINSEIYPMWVRSYAISLSTLTNWMFNLLIAFTFLDLTRLLTIKCSGGGPQRSVRGLEIQKGRIKEAEEVLQKISGSTNVEKELQEISQTIEAETEYSSHGFIHLARQVLQNVPVMRAIAIGCALQAFQQLGGINTVMYYSTTMIKMSGVKDNTQAIWLSCIPSFMNSAFALVSMVIVERLPRRRLLLSTLLGTIVGLSLLGGAYYTIGTTTAPSDPTNSTCGGSGVTNCDTCVAVDGCAFCAPTRSEMGRCFIPTGADNCTDPTYYRTDDVCYSPYSWTLIAAMVFYIAMFATGIGTLAWTINSEIYPMWVRSYAISLSTLTNWMFNLLIAFTFLDLTRLLTKYGAFWMYTCVTIVGWLIFYFRLPETRGVPLENVEQLFS
eukprot:sb/3463462/